MRKLIIAGDWHCSPVMPEDRKFKIDILMRYASDCDIVLSEVFDYLEFGKSVFAYPFCAKVVQWLNESSNRILLDSNHHHDRSLKKSIVVHGIYISHWHEFDLLWGWLPIFRMPLPSWLVKSYRTPSKKIGSDYHLATAQVEHTARQFALSHDYWAAAGGHTHSPFTEHREGKRIANYGDFVDSFSWLEYSGNDLEARSIRDIE